MVQLTVKDQIKILQNDYKLVDIVDLDQWPDHYDQAKKWLRQKLQSIHKDCFDSKERIIFKLTKDYFVKTDTTGLILKNLQLLLNEVDISNFFVIVLSTNAELISELQQLNIMSQDAVAVTGIVCSGQFDKIVLDQYPTSYEEIYQYGSANPIKVNLNDLSSRDKFLLADSKVFCMYPWIHLHAFPNGDAHPCCYSEMAHGLGCTKTHTINEIWNDQPMKQLRQRMLSEQPSSACKKCYEQETSGFFSGRQSANKHFGHHIAKVQRTNADGYLKDFEMIYWDIRFSNLCNLRCRSCGHIFSSQWYQDQAALAGPEWRQKNTVLNFAGRTETDMWEQLLPHLDYVEQIYFAGGEPLMMAEHYNILDELEKRQRFDVRLIYNTNFTQVKLKDRYVFDYWKKFKSVSVGASLDAMGVRAEYIRKGTDWSIVEDNRRRMLDTCPEVDFYISPTVSIMNALHVPDFHRHWVDQQFINPQDLNVNILQDPAYYRIDIASQSYKEKIAAKFSSHLTWLRPQDKLQRASVGFESAINFMNATDNSSLLGKFWQQTERLDNLRQEKLLEVIPELVALKQ